MIDIQGEIIQMSDTMKLGVTIGTKLSFVGQIGKNFQEYQPVAYKQLFLWSTMGGQSNLKSQSSPSSRYYLPKKHLAFAISL